MEEGDGSGRERQTGVLGRRSEAVIQHDRGREWMSGQVELW